MLQSMLQWVFNNKMLTFLSLLCFSLFVSTIALSVERSNAWRELDACRIALDVATTTTLAPTTPEVTTPSTTPEEPTTPEDNTVPEPEGGTEEEGGGTRRRKRHTYKSW